MADDLEQFIAGLTREQVLEALRRRHPHWARCPECAKDWDLVKARPVNLWVQIVVNCPNNHPETFGLCQSELEEVAFLGGRPHAPSVVVKSAIAAKE